MQTLASILGTVSGLRFVASDLEPDVTIATSLAMHITYAIICRIFAAQRDRPPTPWLAAGFFTGVFAVAALIMLGDREPATDEPGSERP